MSFMGNRGNDRDTKKKRSTMGLLFNPNIGSSLKTLKESLYVFVKLIALVFAQADLIDRRHPVITGVDNQRYTLTEVIMLAYQRVEWKQENLPQVSVFVGVCACLGICAMAFVYIIVGGAFGLVAK